MDDEDLFAVFTERPGVAAAAARQPEGLAATKAPLQIIEYEGFCVDAAPELFDWRAVQSSASVEGWKTVTFLPLIAVPLPLARRTGRLKEDEHRGGAPDSVAEARAGVSAAKKPAGNACFNCGESGHNVQCCPQPRDNDAINKRRKAWESDRAPRPSWMDEPRYFVAPSESKVGHVRPGILSSELCAALGISSSHLVPPPYLSSMIREGYPPGFVGIEGVTENGDEEEEEETLRFICGGEEMDLSDEDKEDGEAGASRSHKAGQTRQKSGHAGKKAVMTVVFPGAFGAPSPPGVDPRLWDFSPRAHIVNNAFQMHLFQGLVQQQYTPVPHSHTNAAISTNGSHIYHNLAAQPNPVYAAPAHGPSPLAPAPTQPYFHYQRHERGAQGYYGVGGVIGGDAGAGGYAGGYRGTYGNDYSTHNVRDYRAAHGCLPASGGGAWASASQYSQQSQHPASQYSQQSQQPASQYNQHQQYNQTQSWGGTNNSLNPGGFGRYQ